MCIDEVVQALEEMTNEKDPGLSGVSLEMIAASSKV